MVWQRGLCIKGPMQGSMRTPYEVLVYLEQTDDFCFQSSQLLGGLKVTYILVWYTII